MTISKGDRLPSTTFVKMTENGPEQVQSAGFFKRRKLPLFSVTGAFTHTFSATHLSGNIEKAGGLKAKGVEEIACTAVSTAIVMASWGNSPGSQATVTSNAGR